MTLNYLVMTLTSAWTPTGNDSKLPRPIWTSTLVAVLTVAAIEIGAHRFAPKVASEGSASDADALAAIAEAGRQARQLLWHAALNSGVIEIDGFRRPWISMAVFQGGWDRVVTSCGKACLVSPYNRRVISELNAYLLRSPWLARSLDCYTRSWLMPPQYGLIAEGC